MTVRRRLAGVVLFAMLPAFAVARQTADHDAVLAAAHEVMTAAANAALITVDGDGVAQARIMDPFAPGDDLVVWMATNADTTKVAELRRDARATLLYFDRDSGAYVSLAGEVALVSAREAPQRFWKPEWAPFYTDEDRGGDYLLLRFVPDRLEIVSPAHGLGSDPRAWAPVVVELDRGDG